MKHLAETRAVILRKYAQLGEHSDTIKANYEEIDNINKPIVHTGKSKHKHNAVQNHRNCAWLDHKFCLDESVYCIYVKRGRLNRTNHLERKTAAKSQF